MNLFFIILCLGSQRAENAVISHYYQSTVWLVCLTFERQMKRLTGIFQIDLAAAKVCKSHNTHTPQI